MRIIKKYANRKLYDTVEKTYISMDRLAELIKGGGRGFGGRQSDGSGYYGVNTFTASGQGKEGTRIPKNCRTFSPIYSEKAAILFFGYAKKYSSRWQSAMTLAEDELEKITKILFKGRDVGEEDQKNFKQGLLGQADKLKHWISDKVDQRVNDVIGMMKLVTREELKTVIDTVTALEKRVLDLEEKQEKM